MWTWKRQGSRAKLAQRYFASMPSVPDRTEEIRKAIRETGVYRAAIEWRISTATVLAVEPVEVRGKCWYRASATCDHEFTCHTLTIERAAQFLRIYEKAALSATICSLFCTFGHIMVVTGDSEGTQRAGSLQESWGSRPD